MPEATVMTVAGPIRAADLGVTLMHEHVFVDLWRELAREGVLSDLDLAVTELADYVDAGGRTLVECSTREIGRDPGALRAVAQRTGLQIIMGTGHYRHPYLDREWFDRNGVDRVAEQMIRDITEGADGSDVKSGIIAEVGTEREWISAAEERAFRAAARAQRATGVPISTHAVCWPVGTAQLDLLEEEGVDPGRVIIGHCDTVFDPRYHLALARRGAFVQFDTIRGRSEHEIEQRLGFVQRLADAGHLDRVLLSQDVCVRGNLRAYGGNGYSFILRSFVPRLRGAGFAKQDIDRLLVLNPRQALAGS